MHVSISLISTQISLAKASHMFHLTFTSQVRTNLPSSWKQKEMQYLQIVLMITRELLSGCQLFGLLSFLHSKSIFFFLSKGDYSKFQQSNKTSVKVQDLWVMCDSLFIKKEVRPNRRCQDWLQLPQTSELKMLPAPHTLNIYKSWVTGKMPLLWMQGLFLKLALSWLP